MESYVVNGCGQWEFIMGSTGVLNGKVFWMLLGILLCPQQDIIGVLNGKLCTQWGMIMCSTGHSWGAQQEIRCSMGSYVLNGKLLCAQWEIIMCSTGHYWGAQREVMCSTGVLNGKLLVCSTGS